MSTKNLFFLTIVTVALSVLSGCTTTVSFRPRTGPRYHHSHTLSGGRVETGYTNTPVFQPSTSRWYYDPTNPTNPPVPR